MTWPPPHLSFFLPLVKNWHFAFSFLFHFASPLFFFLSLFLRLSNEFCVRVYVYFASGKESVFFFFFFFSVQGVLRCYNIPVFKLDCAFSDNVALVSTWSFSMSFFFFPLSFFIPCGITVELINFCLFFLRFLLLLVRVTMGVKIKMERWKRLESSLYDGSSVSREFLTPIYLFRYLFT